MRRELCLLHRKLHEPYERWKPKRIVECYNDRVDELVWGADGVRGWRSELDFYCGRWWRGDLFNEYSHELGVSDTCFERYERSRGWQGSTVLGPMAVKGT